MTEPPLKRQKLAKRLKKKPVKPGSADATILFSVCDLLGVDRVEQLIAERKDYEAPFERFHELEVEVKALSSHGDGLALAQGHEWIIVVPFCLPDLVRLVRGAPESSCIRDDSLIKCEYFGRCSGCQYQQVPYVNQLEIKQSVVQRAFAHAADLSPSAVPAIQPTLPSPLQYNYRTKLTPHFNPPSGRDGEPMLAIGFEEKGRKRVVDIERCPIATREVNEGLKRERKRVEATMYSTIRSFKRGATLLLRHAWPVDADQSASAYCETDHKKIVRERVGLTQFEFTAGSFFQNNNSILPDLLHYVGEQLDLLHADGQKRYLVDAYCGSGLFSISLAARFARVKGVEISGESVRFAKRNAELNGVGNAEFIEGKAEAIFASIDFPAGQTTIIIDPPRKGCDELFLSQLVAFGPEIIVYVSCSVHTQAPDVAYLVNKGSYDIRTLRGIDLFPMTHHVECVACLSRRRL